MWLGAGLAAMVGYLWWFAAALSAGDYGAWGTLLVAPSLVAASVPLLRRALGAEPDSFVRAVVVWGFALKLVMAFVNHAVAFGLYGGVADARGYHGAGVAYAAAFRSGHFELAQGGELGRRFVNALTGGVYTVIGPTKLGGYLVFSWFGFWGLYLFHRAFVLAVPGGDHRRCAVLTLLLPSPLFWSSAIGKEAWMVLTLGVASLGAARLVTRCRGGLSLVALGLGGASMCRPHVGLIAFVALAVAFVFRRPAEPRRPLGPLATLACVAALLVVGSVLSDRFMRTFELGSLGPGSVGTALEAAERQSGGGASAFSTAGVPRPLAAAGVLFRPFPFEARSLPSLLAAGEGLIMLGLVVAGRRRLLAAARRLLSAPYLVYCAAYTALFAVAFSVFANFGTLARERVQVVPFVVVLLSLPAARRPSRFETLDPPAAGARY